MSIKRGDIVSATSMEGVKITEGSVVQVSAFMATVMDKRTNGIYFAWNSSVIPMFADVSSKKGDIVSATSIEGVEITEGRVISVLTGMVSVMDKKTKAIYFAWASTVVPIYPVGTRVLARNGVVRGRIHYYCCGNGFAMVKIGMYQFKMVRANDIRKVE